jgi:hypothetical protein
MDNNAFPRVWPLAPIFVTVVPWVVIAVAWIAMRPAFVPTTDFEQFFGPEAWWQFFVLVIGAWAISAIALVASLCYLPRRMKSPVLWVCVVFNAVVFLGPIGLLAWRHSQ